MLILWQSHPSLMLILCQTSTEWDASAISLSIHRWACSRCLSSVRVIRPWCLSSDWVICSRCLPSVKVIRPWCLSFDRVICLSNPSSIRALDEGLLSVHHDAHPLAEPSVPDAYTLLDINWVRCSSAISVPFPSLCPSGWSGKLVWSQSWISSSSCIITSLLEVCVGSSIWWTKL